MPASAPAPLGRRSTTVATSLLAFLILSRAVGAQAHGGVAGVVSSERGEPLEGARVSVQLPSRVAVAGPGGRYRLRDLPAGRYGVTVTALGYRLQRAEVDITAGRETPLDLRLAPGPLLLSGVVTSATRMPSEASRVATTVNVLTPEQIATSPARETQDLLRELPGVELPRTSSLVGGSSQIVSIRGVDEGRTAVLFDGIPVTDAWGEWVDWGRVPRALLDRVEVLEGGGSNLYGNGAMGGVISFFSHPIVPGGYQLQLDGGSRGAKHAFGAGGLPIAGALSALVSGDYLDGGGYTLIAPAGRGPVDHPSVISSRNGLARVEYSPSSRLTAFVGGTLYDDNRDLGSTLAHTNRSDRRATFGADYADASVGSVSLRGWDGVMVEDQYTSAITPAAGRTTEKQTAWQRIPSHDWGASLQWARGELLPHTLLIVGGDVRKMSGNVEEEDYSTATGATTANIISGGAQLLTGAFVQGVIAPVAPLRIELGGRYDRWGNDDGFSTDAAGTTQYPNETRTHFSPRLGARYQLVPQLSLHAAVYDAFRAPNLSELYRKFVSGGNTNLPNPRLSPESAKGQEVGFDLQPVSWAQLKATYYSAIYSDLNTFVTIAAGQRQRQNVQRTRSTGGEGYLALRPLDALFVSASVNYDHAVVVSDPINPANVGNYIGRVPQQRQVIRATWRTPAIGALTALWRHEGKNSTFSGAPLEPFTVVDLNLARDLASGVSAFVAVENVANREYQVNLTGTIVSLGLPRTTRVGMSVSRS